MKRRWIIGSAGLLVLVTGVVLFNFLWPDRLTSEASIRRWVRTANDRDPKVRQQANERFEKAADPTRACVILLQIQPTRWEKLYADYLPKIFPKLPARITRGLPPPRLDDYRNYRWLCLEDLERFLGQRDVTLPLIIGALKDASNRIRGKAAMTLGNLGAAARTAVPALTEALRDSHSNVREAAEAALKKID